MGMMEISGSREVARLKAALGEAERYMANLAEWITAETANLVAEPQSESARHAVTLYSQAIVEQATKVSVLRRQVRGAESVARSQS